MRSLSLVPPHIEAVLIIVFRAIISPSKEQQTMRESLPSTIITTNLQNFFSLDRVGHHGLISFAVSKLGLREYRPRRNMPPSIQDSASIVFFQDLDHATDQFFDTRESGHVPRSPHSNTHFGRQSSPCDVDREQSALGTSGGIALKWLLDDQRGWS